MNFINGYLISKYEFRTVKNDYTTAVTPDIYHQYHDIETGMLYLWDSKQFRDASFYQGYQYSKYDSVERILPEHIYLAQPGHRIIGRINGIDDDSCSLNCNLNNADELSFTVNRMIDGEEIPFYEQIARLYELYIPNYGWFKITEEPQIDNDGTVETKSVTAESLEIELQQYDLVDFNINTGDPSSKEMLATDNTYEEFEYTIARDNVLFYRDTTKLEKDIELFQETDGSVDSLKEFVADHTELIYSKNAQYGYSTGCWRITRDENNEIQIDATHAVTKEEQEAGISYPDYTGTEILDMELARQHELSLLWLILHEHGWHIGFVDPTVDLNSESEMDRNPLAYRVDSFEIDSQDIYSFLTQEVSSIYRCIFVFDTDNYLVHAYNLNNVGFNTNIFLSFRNIQNQITRSSDRELYTVFHVRGDENLDFTEANFGEDTVTDISYFLNTDHFSQEFIDKYNAWLEYRESRRDEYKTTSVDYREKIAKANEIYSRVPLDNVEGKQYSTMSVDELNEERARMEATKNGLEALYVDSEGNFDYDALAESDDRATYDTIVNFVLSSPLDALDYATQEEYIDPIDDKTKYEQNFDFDRYEQDHGEEIDFMRLGNIDIAIYNKRVIDGYYTDPSMSDEEKRNRTRSKYQIEYLDDYNYDFETYGYMFGVAELEAQLATLEQNLSALKTSGYDDSDGTIYDEETYDQYIKYKEAYDSCKEVLEERKQEYQDAKDEIQTVVDTQAQIKEDVSITNPDFGFTDDELALLDKYYIHSDYTNNNILITDVFTNQEIVEAEYQLYLDAIDQLYVESHPQYLWSTTQDNLLLMPEFQNWHGQLHVGNFIWVSFRDDYHVKLRISSISLNPLMIEPEIQIDFTTMVSYKSRRNDYADLLASNNASMKNSISTSINSRSNSDNSINIDTALVMKLLNSQAFSGYMNSNNYNANSNAVIIAGDTVQAANINVGQLVGQQAEFDEMFTNYLKSNIIISNMLNARNATIDDLTVEIIRIGHDGITQITNDTISTANINVGQITGSQAQFDTMFTDHLQTISETTAKSVIDQAYVTNLVAGNISVADLATHNATADQIVLISDDGDPTIAFKNSTQQFYDSDGNVRVQIGQDGNGDFNFLVRGTDGSTALFNENGITQNGIPNSTIVNNMISDGTIQKAKVAFNVADANADGTVSIGSIKDGSGGNFGVEYATFKNDTNTSISGISSDIDGINDKFTQKVWQSDIDAAAGTISDRISTVEQTADKINLAITVIEDGVTHETSLSVTPEMIAAISDKFKVGNNTNYIIFNSQTGELVANLSTLSIGGTPAATSTQVNDARKVATNYLYYNNTDGLVVHQNGTEISDVSDLTGNVGNVRITGDGMDIYRGQTKTASYGSEVVIGPSILSAESPSNIRINTNGFQYNNGGDEAFYVGVEQRVVEVSEESTQNAVLPEDTIDRIVANDEYVYVGDLPPNELRLTMEVDPNVPEEVIVCSSYLDLDTYTSEGRTKYKYKIAEIPLSNHLTLKRLKPDSVVRTSDGAQMDYQYRFADPDLGHDEIWVYEDYHVTYRMITYKAKYNFISGSTFKVIQESNINPGYYDLLRHEIDNDHVLAVLNNANDVSFIYRANSSIIQVNGLNYFLIGTNGLNKVEVDTNGNIVIKEYEHRRSLSEYGYEHTGYKTKIIDNTTYYKACSDSIIYSRDYYIDGFSDTEVVDGIAYYKIGEHPLSFSLKPNSVQYKSYSTHGSGPVQYYTVTKTDTYEIWAIDYIDVVYTIYTNEKTLSINAYYDSDKSSIDYVLEIDNNIYTIWVPDYHGISVDVDTIWTHYGLKHSGEIQIVDGKIYTNHYQNYFINNDNGATTSPSEDVMLVASSDTTINSNTFIERAELAARTYYKVYDIPENVIVKSVVKSSDHSIAEYYIQDNGLWVADDFNVIYTIAYVGDTTSPYFVFGPNNYSSALPAGKYSFAAGEYCSAQGSNQFVIGKYNERKTSPAFIIGNGEADNNRSNALEIDWHGNVMTYGSLYSENVTTYGSLYSQNDDITATEINNYVFG